MSDSLFGDMDLFQEQLASQLAEYLPITDMARIVHAVESVTRDWSVHMQTMRPITDPHIRFEIYTPWNQETGHLRREVGDDD